VAVIGKSGGRADENIAFNLDAIPDANAVFNGHSISDSRAIFDETTPAHIAFQANDCLGLDMGERPDARARTDASAFDDGGGMGVKFHGSGKELARKEGGILAAKPALAQAGETQEE